VFLRRTSRTLILNVMDERRTRRWGAGKAATVRRLYDAREPITQVELAAHARVSQPAVSQYLSSLRANGDAVFENPGWLPVRAQLPDTYLRCYSSRFTDQLCWYRIDAVTAQVADLIDRRGDLVVSGDVGADLIRPWRVPTTAIVYGDVGGDLMGDLGFVRADGEATASVLIRPVPDDRFEEDAEQLQAMRVAPRLHLVADLIGLGGDDRIDAAKRFEPDAESASA